jgi:hypothetical protein
VLQSSCPGIRFRFEQTVITRLNPAEQEQNVEVEAIGQDESTKLFLAQDVYCLLLNS